MLTISTAPHMAGTQTTRSIMRDVVIALLPAAAAAVLFFGVNALLVMLSSVAACVMFEYLISRYLLKIGNTARDFSAVITGILLAFNLPCNMPIPMIMLGAFMAIGVSKMAFGGLGKNLFNPALVGRVFLFISFPVQMTSWPRPAFLHFLTPDTQTAATTLGILKHYDVQSSATALHQGAQAVLPNYWDMFSGNIGGSLGEISALALLLGLFYMLWRKIITWHIPFYYIGTVFILTAVFWFATGNLKYDPLTHILSGGLMLGAVFMATDYVTSPMSVNGKIFFAVCCGVLTVVIRFFGAYPEGVSFAILIMNAFVPLIDKYFTPRVFGTSK